MKINAANTNLKISLETAIACVIGILGIYWLLERIASFREVSFS
jgi:hypothetical protein